MDINQIITDKIINLLERGTIKTGARWTGSKATGLPVNAKSGERYHGINVLVLWAEMAEKCYASSQWLTFKQAADMGANVRKGEKSVMCVYYRTVPPPLGIPPTAAQKGQLSLAVPERAPVGTTTRLPCTTPLCRMAYPEVRPTVVTDGPVSAITPNLLWLCPSRLG